MESLRMMSSVPFDCDSQLGDPSVFFRCLFSARPGSVPSPSACNLPLLLEEKDEGVVLQSRDVRLLCLLCFSLSGRIEAPRRQLPSQPRRSLHFTASTKPSSPRTPLTEALQTAPREASTTAAFGLSAGDTRRLRLLPLLPFMVLPPSFFEEKSSGTEEEVPVTALNGAGQCSPDDDPINESQVSGREEKRKLFSTFP